MFIRNRGVRKMLTYRVCPASEIFVELIIQMDQFLSYIFRIPHCSFEHCCLISVFVDCWQNSLYFSKKKLLNDFLMHKARSLKALERIFEYRIFRSSGWQLNFHTSSASKLKSAKISATYLLPDKDGFCVSFFVTGGLCLPRLSVVITWTFTHSAVCEQSNMLFSQQALWRSLVSRVIS